MLQWILLAFGLFNLAQGYINKVQVPVNNSVVYYYSNDGRVFYLGNDGYYYEVQRPLQYENQVQGQETLGTSYWTQGTQTYYYGQPSQTPTYTPRY